MTQKKLTKAEFCDLANRYENVKRAKKEALKYQQKSREKKQYGSDGT